MGEPDFRVYLITDRKMFRDEDELFSGLEEAFRSGVRAVQLREKDLPVRDCLRMACRLRELTGRYGVRLFINDRVDIAMAVGADGVHLGTGSVPAHAAKKAGGRGMLVGASTHSIDEAVRAEQEGADFITIGPIFETPSKAKYGKPLGTGIISRVRDRISIPVFAIGGISIERIKEVMNLGASGIALISAILASGTIGATAGEFVRLTE